MNIKKSRLFTHSRLYALLGIYLLLTIGYNVIIPTSGSGDDADDVGHFLFIRFIADQNHLPTTWQEREEAGYRAVDGFPPFYQGVAGLLFSGLKAEKVKYLEPRGSTTVLLGEATAGFFMFHTVLAKYPYQGSTLLWHLSRLYSSLLGVGTIIVTYFISLLLFPGKKTPALMAAAIIAFLPRFVFVTATLSDDNMLAFLLALYLFFMIKVIKGRHHWAIFAIIGGLLGLSITTKPSVGLLPFFTVFFFCFLAWQQKWFWQKLVKSVTITTVTAILAASWWFVYVVWYFNEIETQGLIAGIFAPILAAGSVSSLSITDVLTDLQGGETAVHQTGTDSYLVWLTHFYQSFWEAKFWLLPHHFLITGTIAGNVSVLIGLSLIIIGLVLFWRQADRFQRTWLGFFTLFVLSFVPFMLIRHQMNRMALMTAQGRHVVIPAASAIGILLMVGWWHWTRPRKLSWLRPILPALLLFWSVTQLALAYHIYPQPFPVSNNEATHSQIPTPAVPLNQMLFDSFELLGYSTNLLPEQSALEVTLVWKTYQPPFDDYLTEIQLLDQNGQVVSTWIGHPGGGLFPTRAWLWGDMVYEQAKLPIFDLNPGSYTVLVSLLDGYQRPIQRVTDPLFTTTVDIDYPLDDPSGLKQLSVETENNTIQVNYQTWPFDFFDFNYPRYHYRSTIPLAWQSETVLAPNQVIKWYLVAPDDRLLEPLNEQGNLKNFVVDPDWPAGFYYPKVTIWQNDEIIGEQVSPNPITVESVHHQPTAAPLPYQVDANFYNMIKLLDYDLSASRLQAGELLSITARWELLHPVSRRFNLFNHLYDLDNKIWTASDYQFPVDDHPNPMRSKTSTLVPGDVINDKSAIWFDPEIPPGIYTIHFGLYFESTADTQIRLPLIIDEQVSDITHIILGPIKVGHPPLDVLVAEVNPQYQANHNLGDIIKLKGYDYTYSADNQALQLTLYWESLQATDKNYTTFVHLQDETGQIITQKDGPPAGGIYPTLLWDSGEVIKDEITLILPANFTANNYHLLVGMYDSTTGERLDISNSPDNALKLTAFNPAN